MKYIKLTKENMAIIDDQDYEYLNQFHWSIDGSGYPQRAIKTRKGWRPIRMHRDLLNLKPGEIGDHINGDKLDNRRSNLRKCDKKGNNRNRGLLRNNTSGHIGVVYRKDKWRNKRWMATIHIDNKKKYIGTYLTREEAIIAYNEAASKYFGEFARLNTL